MHIMVTIIMTIPPTIPPIIAPMLLLPLLPLLVVNPPIQKLFADKHGIATLQYSYSLIHHL